MAVLKGYTKYGKSVTIPKTLEVTDVDYATCEFCNTSVKKRGLRNHQRSRYCMAFQLALNAEKEGLVRLEIASASHLDYM